MNYSIVNGSWLVDRDSCLIAKTGADAGPGPGIGSCLIAKTGAHAGPGPGIRQAPLLAKKLFIYLLDPKFVLDERSIIAYPLLNLKSRYLTTSRLYLLAKAAFRFVMSVGNHFKEYARARGQGIFCRSPYFSM